MTLLKDNNYKEINVALLSLEADIKNKITGFDTSVIDKQLAEINSRIDKINDGSNNTSDEIEDINYKLNRNSNKIKNIERNIEDIDTKIDDIEQKLSDIFSAENKVTDFNTTKDSGIYYWTTDAANRPGNYGVLLVNKYDGGSGSIWINQVAYDTTNKIHFRQNINNGNWTEWKAIAFEGEVNARFLDIYSSTRPTSGNIVPKDSSEWGGMRKDVVTGIMTDSGRPGAAGHLLTMFWDSDGRWDNQLYISNDTGVSPALKVRQKQNGADYGPWTDIITSNNIGSQTVANATNARTNADQGFLCKLYALDSATSDSTTQAYNVILLGKIPDPASTAAPANPSTSWDIDVDFYFVRSQGHKAAWCNVKAGYGYSNAWRKYGSIETFGVDVNSNYTNPFYLVTLKYNNEYYIGVRHAVDIDGSYSARVKYVNTNYNGNPSTVDNTPLVNMLKVIPYQKTNGNVLNSEIKTSIADFPNTYAPTVVRNGNLVLYSGGAPGSKLIIQGATVNSNSYTDTNPKLEFKNIDGSQSISLTFTDYDAVKEPASLTLNGNQGNEYFIAPCIKANNKMRIPIGEPSSLEDGCIWIER